MQNFKFQIKDKIRSKRTNIVVEVTDCIYSVKDNNWKYELFTGYVYDGTWHSEVSKVESEYEKVE